ncbi:hypothetical protein RI129_009428 [Pyrocoelia pectoralis]|uniref:Uncharacterized protein n=1 Tax=Pyrocoelia pectoralis TaxID=417401 RepID=A0AAN7ZHV4_9COLE
MKTWFSLITILAVSSGANFDYNEYVSDSIKECMEESGAKFESAETAIRTGFVSDENSQNFLTCFDLRVSKVQESINSDCLNVASTNSSPIEALFNLDICVQKIFLKFFQDYVKKNSE